MKYVGFIKEYNIIDSAKPLQDVIKYHDVKPDYLDIINYLKDGILAFAWMGYFVDIETKALIAPDSYFTDGLWVWPAYLPYYLSKYPGMHLDHDFVEYLRLKNYEITVCEFEIARIENEISIKLNNSVK
ncbi:hypothetical protein D3C87_546940 [compost metagenome]